VGGFAFWSIMVVVGAMQYHSYQHFADKALPISWGFAFRRAAEEWYLWGLLSVLVLWFARRFPIQRERWGIQVLRHVVMAALIALVYNATIAAIRHGQRSVDGSLMTFGKAFKKLMIFYSCEHVILYCALVMGHHGWHYYRRARERELQTAELQGLLSRARLDVLRMQLNPHFLFNTLNTISALIHERPEDADRMVVRLSELLRISLECGGDQEVPLARELALLERFLEIQSIRFPDRLSVAFNVEPQVKSAAVPCMILQPIVENAVRHGIEARDTGGRIEIGARGIDGRLELEVTDNGPGLAASPAPEGVGLTNTRARLRHHYGERQQLELLPAPGGGLRVRLIIPWSKEPAPVVCAKEREGCRAPNRASTLSTGAKRG
jgi:signal transduction histidine kinase